MPTKSASIMSGWWNTTLCGMADLSANYAFLSYLAGRTQNIRLATGATVMALNDPVRVAEHAATLDQLSNGRFDLGVGRGFIRDEFDSSACQ